MRADLVLILEARNNSFEIFVREGSAMTRLNAIAFEMVVSDSANAEFVMNNLVGQSSRTQEIQRNIMKIVYSRVLNH